MDYDKLDTKCSCGGRDGSAAGATDVTATQAAHEPANVAAAGAHGCYGYDERAQTNYCSRRGAPLHYTTHTTR